MFQFEGYNPMDEELDDDDQFLSKIPADLIKENIRDQFIDPVENHKRDYVQSFISKYDFSKMNQDIEDEDIIELDQIYEDFVSYMQKIMKENLSLGFPTIEDESDDEVLEILQLTYRFFISRIKKNFIGVILNYIHENGELLLETLPKKKDVTTMNFEDVVSELDLRILSNLDSVIDLALERGYDVDEFITACAYDDDSIETDFMKKSFDENKITGNFVEPYVAFVDDGLRSELASKVRNKILKNYPLSKKS